MECCLAEGELIRLDGGKEGLELCCTIGTVWLTKGDGMDYLIPAGKRLKLAKGESALVEALRPSDFRVGKPAAIGGMAKPVLGLAGC